MDYTNTKQHKVNREIDWTLLSMPNVVISCCYRNHQLYSSEKYVAGQMNTTSCNSHAWTFSIHTQSLDNKNPHPSMNKVIVEQPDNKFIISQSVET